jgi:hypothetical protein
MPMPAAGLADVLGGDPNPLVGPRIGGHLLDQPPVLLLDLAIFGQAAPDPLQARGERVTHPLQLVHAEDAGSAGSGHPELDPHSGEGGAE